MDEYCETMDVFREAYKKQGPRKSLKTGKSGKRAKELDVTNIRLNT